MRIGDPALDTEEIALELWNLIESLEIVTNDSKIVSGTKALHHLLPDLVPPMDHAYTQPFFERHHPDFQYRGGSTFTEILVYCSYISKMANAGSYVEIEQKEKTWHTSISKVIDNAVIGYCIKNSVS